MFSLTSNVERKQVRKILKCVLDVEKMAKGQGWKQCPA